MSERSSQRPPVIQSLESMIEMLKLDKKYKEALKYGTNNYNVSQYKINKVKLEQIPQLVNLIDLNYINLERDLSQNSDKKKYNWLANQLKLFVWTSICHSFLINKPLEDYEETDWTFFTFIFTRKNSNDLEFQSKSLFKNYHGNKQKWDSEQQQLLRQIIDDEQNKNKWNEISRLLYFKSNKKYYRSSQKCRQYWFNHLDPALKKSPWTVDQDLRLVRELQIYGFKWSKLTQIIENNWGYRRTEHMVKNRTKFLCKKYGFKDDKEQGCTKQLKLIQKKLTEQKAKGIQGQKEEYDMNSGSQSAQDVKIQQKQLNYNFLQRNVLEQRNQQQMKLEENHEQKKPDFDESSESEEDDFESVKKPTKTSFKEEDKNNKKRNVIILYHAEKQKQAVNAPQPDIMEEEESPQIMLEQNNEDNAQQSEQHCGHHKQESYYDEYNIIEEVPQIDLNQDIQFQHDTHGGRMRQRVTHELAKFFPSETGSQAN